MHDTVNHVKSRLKGDSSQNAEDDIPQYPAILPVELIDRDGDGYRRAELADDAFSNSFDNPWKKQRQRRDDQPQYRYPLNEGAAE